MILAGDIGGTHTRLALFEQGRLVVEEKFSSRNYSDLEEIVKEFLKQKNAKISKACFGVAGPVRQGRCKTTNLPWELDTEKISKTLQISSVFLLNDLQANAYGLKVLKQESLFCLHKGKQQEGNQALISAGTGLGEAGLYWDGKEHRPFASEGGHTDFAARNELETELFLYLKKKFGHVSYERVVSGPGLHEIYQFLTTTQKVPISQAVEKEMKEKNPSLVISDWGSKDKDLACKKALDCFLSLYGAEAGNLALKYLALGGVFIGGGIAPHLVEHFKKGPFLASFFDKGRFKELLESIPIWIVLNDDAALLGAAYFATRG